MLVLLLSSLMILASCGTQIDVKDPQVNVDGGSATATKDEEKAKEEENVEVTTTTTSSSSKSSSTTTTTVTGSQEVLAAVIPPPATAPTKIKKGLSKEQVLALLGAPDRVDDWDVELHWVYIEKEGEEKYCIDYYDGGMDDECYVSFDADSDLVNSQYSFNTDYIDLLGF